MRTIQHHPYSRRQFLGAFAAAIPLLSFGKIEPEIILFNGNIFTVNPKEPTAQALAIAGWKVNGSWEQCRHP